MAGEWVTDSIPNDSGGTTDFYNDGSWIAYDENQQVIDYAGAQGGAVTQINQNPRTPAPKIINNSDGTYFIVDAQNNATQYSANGVMIGTYNTDGSFTDTAGNTHTAAQSVAIQTGGVEQPDGTVLLPGMTKAQQDALLQKAVTFGGQWLAKQVGGNTVLYRKQSGGIGSLDVKSLLIPGAIIAALMLTS